jgi:glycosyltransferase involved in cell wall biosynthesis
MTPLRILHVAANRWWTGSADPTIQLIRALRERDHLVLLAVTPGDRFEVRAREAGIDLVTGLRLQPRLAPLSLLRDLRRLRVVLEDEGIDLVHAHHSHDHWLAALACRPGATGVRPPVVRTFHNLRAVRRGRAAAWLYRRADGVLAVSHQIRERCLEVGLPASRVRTLPGTVDLQRFREDGGAAAVREEFELGGFPVVVSVSRLAPHRGHELLLAGFRRLLERLPCARLLLVGRGERRPWLESLVAELALGDRVIFTGYRDHDLPAVVAAADCFALMGAGSDESCRAALEAMAAARPVVARRVGALPETIVHGQTGLLLDDDRAETVADALWTVLADPHRARAMGMAGRRRVETEFHPQRAATIVEELYRQVLEQEGEEERG